MLQFVLGRSGSGKSRYLLERIEQLARQQQNVVLLIPDQFSFETERNVYETLGAVAAKQVEVLSFRRLCDKIFAVFGARDGSYASKSAKNMLMQLALEEIQDGLHLYGNNVQSRGLRSGMLGVVEELKNAAISPRVFEQAAAQMPLGSIKEKTEDIALIYSAYHGMLEAGYADDLDDLVKACQAVQGNNFFEGSHVFIDEFKGFTKSQLMMLGEVLQSADETVIALCVDLNEQYRAQTLFAPVQDTYHQLCALAQKVGVACKTPVRMETLHRFGHPALLHLEQNLLRKRVQCYDGAYAQFPITAVCSQNEYDEVEYVLSTIAQLVKQGYRYRDIVIVTRQLDIYRTILENEFDKYDIPYFMSAGESVQSKPLFRFVEIFLQLCCKGLDSDLLLKLYKTMLTVYPIEQISALENYVFVWGIGGPAWKKPFTANPDGADARLDDGAMTQKQAAALEQLNQMRQTVADAIGNFLQTCQKGKRYSAKQIGTALFMALSQMQVDTCIQKKVDSLTAQNEDLAAREYLRVWEVFVQMLDTIYAVCGNQTITVSQYARLFEAAVEGAELSSPPQTLDQVMVGRADLLRAENVKVLFVLGVNENVFPLVELGGGILNRADKQALAQTGLEIDDDDTKTLLDERFVAYKTLTMASDKLYLTYRQGDIKGSAMLPSEIILQLKCMYPQFSVVDKASIPMLYFCQTKQTAFLKLAGNLRENNAVNAGVARALADDACYGEKIQLVRRSQQQPHYEIKQPQLSKQLFGTTMSMSPSQVDRYHLCAFQYFCENGLRVQKLRRAEINPLTAGTILHYVLSQLVAQMQFEKYTQEALKQQIKELLRGYLQTYFDGVENKTARFSYLYRKLSETLVKIALQLQREFAQSQFRPADFELKLASDSDTPPLRLETIDGTVVQVSGVVDRVDLCRKNGKTYLKVVDYKSGQKTFHLADVLYGLNLQMLIYLFAIWKNGKGKYQDVIPAGVLYMPASAPQTKLDRHAQTADMEQHEMAHYRMNGLLVNDEQVLRAIDKDLSGLFIPIKTNKEGQVRDSASLVEYAQMGRLYNYLEKLLTQMAQSLQNGQIDAVPVQGLGYDPCAYCDFWSVCGKRDSADKRELVDYTKAELMVRLKAELGDEIKQDEQLSLFGGESDA